MSVTFEPFRRLRTDEDWCRAPAVYCDNMERSMEGGIMVASSPARRGGVAFPGKNPQLSLVTVARRPLRACRSIARRQEATRGNNRTGGHKPPAASRCRLTSGRRCRGDDGKNGCTYTTGGPSRHVRPSPLPALSSFVVLFLSPGGTRGLPARLVLPEAQHKGNHERSAAFAVGGVFLAARLGPCGCFLEQKVKS